MVRPGIFLIFTLFTGILEAQTPLEIHTRYTGLVSLPAAQWGQYSPRAPLVIQTPEEFESFLQWIPPRLLGRKDFMKPSPDLLLKRPIWNWQVQTLAVVFDAVTQVYPPRVVSVQETSEEVQVLYKSGVKPGMLETKVQGYGAYCAVLLPKITKPVKFILLN